MKHYYALFTKTKEAIEVAFPDLPGCVTFGNNMEEAFNNAIDVLAAWLASAEPDFIKEPSVYEKFSTKKGVFVIPVPVNEDIMEQYSTQRINVIFPTTILKKIDRYRKETGLKRSTFLRKASEEYIKRHPISL